MLDVAVRAGASIPTMCYRSDLDPFTACMLCLVADETDGRLHPACSTRAAPTMSIQTHSKPVREARKDALDLLLSEHVGDCEGPCRRFCPAFMAIPKMLRQIADGDFHGALLTVKRHIVLPATLGRICPAPCETGCRRGKHDNAVSICLLKRFVADRDLFSDTPWLPECRPTTNKHVAVIGAGPAGLAAASALLQSGHACTIFDAGDAPGGTLRYDIDPDRLPREILDREIATIEALGATLKCGICIGTDRSLDNLLDTHDAVILATGSTDTVPADNVFGIDTTARGIAVDRKSHMTTRPGVFAAGSAVQPRRMAVRALADGRNAAQAVNRYLTSSGTPPLPRFDSKILDIQPDDIATLAALAAPQARCTEPSAFGGGFSSGEAISEAQRCLHCECAKPDTCLLRKHASTHAASQHHYDGEMRAPVQRILQPAGLVYEPGKCIKCGICIRIAAREREPLGLTFIGRGFDVRIGVPFEKSLDVGLKHAAADCIAACPTGALAWHVA